jgi:hypothetical protein
MTGPPVRERLLFYRRASCPCRLNKVACECVTGVTRASGADRNTQLRGGLRDFGFASRSDCS